MAIAGYNSQVLIASLPSVAFTDEPTSTSDAITYTITNAAHRYFDKSVPVVVQRENDEIQQVSITGAPTGGTFTLTWNGQTTSALNWNATAGQVQSALQALSNIGANNMTVTGGPGPGTPFVCEFVAAMGNATRILMTLANNSLTGGTTPSVTITRILGGQGWSIETNPYTLFRANARIVYPVAQLGNTQVRFHSGNYFPYAQIAEAASCDFQSKIGTEDTTTFASATASNGAHSFTPTTITGTLKYGSFWLNIARAQSLQARDLLIVSFQLPTGNRYEGYCFAQNCDIKSDVNKVVTQDVTFQLTDEFFNA